MIGGVRAADEGRLGNLQPNLIWPFLTTCSIGT